MSPYGHAQGQCAALVPRVCSFVWPDGLLVEKNNREKKRNHHMAGTPQDPFTPCQIIS